MARRRRDRLAPPTMSIGNNGGSVASRASQRAYAGGRQDPPGAKVGQVQTPDARVRQRVFNRNQDARRNMREGRGGGVAGPPEMGFSEGFAVGGGMPRRERPVGTPPGQAAPPPRGTIVDGPPDGGRIQDNPDFRNLPRATQVAIEKGRMSLGEALGRTPEPRRSDPRVGPMEGREGGDPRVRRMEGRGEPEVEAGPVQEGGGDIPPGQQQAPGAPTAPGETPAPPTSAEVASNPIIPTGAEGADQIRSAASAELKAGRMPEPPGRVDASGGFQPSPGMSAQQTAQAVEAQAEAVMQKRPEPPMGKSPLGDDSPIEQADGRKRFRAGSRHHIRALGLKTSGMDPKTAKEFERKAVRDMDSFGEYPGMDDPHSPPPPIRPGKHSFNPMTGKFVEPEGTISLLDRMAPRSTGGPNTMLTTDYMKRGGR